MTRLCWIWRGFEMSCDCVKDLEGKLAEHMRPKAGETVKATCMATGIAITPDLGLEAVFNIPFRICGDKKGFTSLKGREMPVRANYCPFCGKSMKKEVA